MKYLISTIVILGIGVTLLGNNRSIANQSSSQINNLVIAGNSRIEEFIAIGNEPFWSVTVTKSGIVYASPGVKQQTFPYVAPLQTEGRPADKVRLYQLKGKEKNILILNKVSSCNDTMSDRNYPYSAVLILGNKVFEGCAYKK